MLQPLRYHQEMRDLLKSQYAEVWQWFSSVKVRTELSEAVELELLKKTYRMEHETHAEIYQLVDEVVQVLDITVPVTLYQSQGSGSESSAALYFTPEHGHVVFFGGLMELLDADELKSVIAHELSHYCLWTIENGEFHVCDQVLAAICNEPRAELCHMQSARLFQLFAEVFADAGAMEATSENAVVAALLKVHTGMKTADSESYLRQAKAIFEKGSSEDTVSEGVTHPELYIRVKAIEAASAEHYEKEIDKLLVGKMSLDELDMIAQVKLTEQTRAFISYHLTAHGAWLRSEGMLSHVNHFFEGYQFDDSLGSEFSFDLSELHQKVKEYYAYLLVDMASADRELGDAAVAASLLTAKVIGLEKEVMSFLNKELKIVKKDLNRINDKANEMVASADKESQDQLEEVKDGE